MKLRLLLAALFIAIASPSFAQQSYVVGTWNLEHFRDGASRGFPETPGGFDDRGDEEFQFIANTIRALDTKILILQEINADTEDLVDEDGIPFQDERSPELARLIGLLGTNYDYVIGSSGRRQRIAILYDLDAVQLNEVCEANFRRMQVNGKNVFDRQPLYAHFTFLEDGNERNDLVVVGVHLASGQRLTRNHDRAMRDIQREIEGARDEVFWDEMENDGWDVLANDNSYPASRLSGDPLQQRNSKIDYIIVSTNSLALFGLIGESGLAGEEIQADVATVHDDLLTVGATEFRRLASDHMPVTVAVAVTDDTD